MTCVVGQEFQINILKWPKSRSFFLEKWITCVAQGLYITTVPISTMRLPLEPVYKLLRGALHMFTAL